MSQLATREFTGSGEPFVDLAAAVCWQAVIDVRQGNGNRAEALDWLRDNVLLSEFVDVDATMERLEAR